MRFSLVLATLLCFTTSMSVGQAPNVPVASCCLGWYNLKGVPLNRILDYTIQSDGVCRIKAVVFKTTLGVRICSDPNSDWAKEAILKVDEEKKKALQEKGQIEDGLTSRRQCALNQKKTPQKKGRHGRRHQKNKSRRERKG